MCSFGMNLLSDGSLLIWRPSEEHSDLSAIPTKGYGGDGAQKLVQLLLGSGSSRGKSPRSSQTQSRKASPQDRACPLEPWGRLSYCFLSSLSTLWTKGDDTPNRGCPTVPHCWLERNSCPLWALPARNYLLFLLLRPLAMKRLGSGGVGGASGILIPNQESPDSHFPLKSLLPCFLHPL